MPQHRRPRKCPVCDNMVKKLAQHMRTVHAMDKGRAMELSDMMLTHTEKEERTPDNRPRYVCGLEGCHRNVVRKRLHLMRSHKMTDKSAELLEAMGQFTKYHKRPVDAIIVRQDDDKDDDADMIPPSPPEAIPTRESLATSPATVTGPAPAPGTSSGTNRQQGPPRESVATAPATETGPAPAPAPGTSSTLPNSRTSAVAWSIGLRESGGQATTKKTPMDRVLKAYHTFLMSPGGGYKDMKNTTQHVNQVRKWWSSTKDVTTKSLTAENLNQYVQGLVGKVQPGTIKSYLTSILDFTRYASERKIMESHIFDCISSFIKRSYKFLNRLRQQRQVEFEDHTSKELLSEEARGHVLHPDYMKKCSSNFILNPSANYLPFRNGVMLILMVSNAMRSSAIENVTLDQVDEAEKVEVEGQPYYVMTVQQHKTSATRHVQKVTLRRDHYGYVLMLASYVRANMPMEDKRLFRKSQGGILVTSSLINKALQTGWKACGALAMFGRMNATLHRKSVTCLAFDADPNMAAKTAETLKHRVSTADRYYRIKTSAKSSAETIHWLNRSTAKGPAPTPAPLTVTAKTKLPETTQASGKAAAPAELPTESTTAALEHFPGLARATEDSFRRELYKLLASDRLDELIETAKDQEANKRHFIQNTSFYAIHEEFEAEVEERLNVNLSAEILGSLNITVTSPSVEATMMTLVSVELARAFGCDLDPWMSRMDNERDEAALAELSHAFDEPSEVSSVASLPSKRKKFTAEENQKMEEVFGKYITYLLRENRNPVFKEIEEIRRDTFPALTTQQIRDKIKNMMKIRKK